MKMCSHLWQYLAEFILEWEMFQIKVVEKIKTHILFSVTFSFEDRAVIFTLPLLFITEMECVFCAVRAEYTHTHTISIYSIA